MFYFLDGKHPGCDASYFGRREFSFTLENDIYVRFQSFEEVGDLEKAIKHQCPFKIDIGPVYSVNVSLTELMVYRGPHILQSCWNL